MLASAASLALVLALLGGLLWWVRRTRPKGASGGRQMQVVESVALGREQFLHLVRVGERALVVGSTARRCDLICELEALPAEEPAGVPSWAEVFRARLRKP
jgi:flagellar protein FliO/FliZ